MEYSKEQLQTVAATLRKVVTDKNVKMRWGALKRQEMHNALKRGDNSATYRLEWLRKSRTRMLAMLVTVGEEFNRTWKHDRASLHDFMDICAATYKALENELKKS